MPLAASAGFSRSQRWQRSRSSARLLLPPPTRPPPTQAARSFGPTWAHTYNARAVVAGNPVRILAACCRPTERAGVNHCLVTVTLAGTIDRGCELVDIGPSGFPAGPGKHEKCVPREQTA